MIKGDRVKVTAPKTFEDPVKAYAVASLSENQYSIDIKSVYDSRTGSIVNWLTTEKSIPVFMWMDDDFIEQLWKNYRTTEVIVEVQITIMSVEPSKE